MVKMFQITIPHFIMLHVKHNCILNKHGRNKGFKQTCMYNASCRVCLCFGVFKVHVHVGSY